MSRLLPAIFAIALLFAACGVNDATVDPNTSNGSNNGGENNDDNNNGDNNGDTNGDNNNGDNNGDDPNQCQANETFCATGDDQGHCVDLLSDLDHCGDCNQPCHTDIDGATASCLTGSCDIHCDDELHRCGDQCVERQSDADHCGACGNACESDEACIDGSCELDCGDGLQVCDDQCVDDAFFSDSADHCGQCQDACTAAPDNASPACTAGFCDFQCDDGYTDCMGQCVNTDADPDFCGSCTQSCGPDQVCSQGQCVADCPDGQTQCGVFCIDLDTDINHCGECANTCPQPSNANVNCSFGQCTYSCQPGYADCDQECADLLRDPDHCGNCDHTCTSAPDNATPDCHEGLCTYACDVGYKPCEQTCIPDDQICDSCDPDFPFDFGGGSGTSDEPFLICSIEHLQQWAITPSAMGAAFALSADIDLSNAGYAPLASPAAPFEGSFDGGGHTISHLTLDSDDSDVGLFARIGPDGLVANLNLDHLSLSGDSRVGAVAGRNEGTIDAVTLTNASVDGDIEVGGLVGRHESSASITASSAHVSVTTNTDHAGTIAGSSRGLVDDVVGHGDVSGERFIGGLVGINNDGATLTNSFADVAVTATDNFVGGLAGVHSDSATLETSGATGDVSSPSGQSVGGLVGQSQGPIADAFASGSVTGDNGVGGLVGVHLSDDTIARTFAVGLVNSDANGGGLIGFRQSTAGSTDPDDLPLVSHSFFDDSTTDQSSSDGGQPLTTSQFADQNSFPTWDFSSTWSLGDLSGHTRPRLQALDL